THLPTGAVVVSASPELFLDWDHQTGRVVTRPMKGTRPLGSPPNELHQNPKDQAELAMIVDLMRNDLGRIAETGSVRVDEPRAIERHAGGQLQATATVSATLRHGTTRDQLIAATFPPGSVTGAPKIRALQILDELEREPRGVFCGAIGVTDPTRKRTTLAVAIRTATLMPSCDEPDAWDMDLPVGAGIVADSDPEAEWDETLVKAAAFCRVLGVDITALT
ncbi:MAG: chorismate-binding protein, partial [Planctomycetota bacterium]